LGRWVGKITLRDVNGSGIECSARFIEAPDLERPGVRLIYISAHPLNEAVLAGGVADQDMLHALLETTPDSVYFKDTSSRFLRISRALAQRFGLEHPTDAIGKTDFDFFTVEHAAPAFEDEKKILTSGQPMVDFEEKETFDDGRTAWLRTSKLPFRDREGKLIGTYGISRDVSLRKVAEDEIRQREAMLRSTFAAAPVGIALAEGRIIKKVNDLMCEITGYSTEELLGQKAELLYADRAEFKRIGDELFDRLPKGGHGHIDTIFKRKDGKLIHVLLSVAFLDTPELADWRIVTALDTTERKLAEQKLLKLSLAIEQSPVSIVVANVRGIIEYVNPYFERVTGYTAAEVIGQTPRILKSGHHSPEFYQHLWSELQAGRRWSGELCNKKKNGELHWERVAISGLRDATGQITHYVAVKEDITQQKKAELERQELAARLQVTSKLESVGSLAAGVAHEINTPTQFISDNVRFLITAYSQFDAILKAHARLVNEAANDPRYEKTINEIKRAEDDNERSYLEVEVPRCLEQSLDGLKRISKIVSSLKEFSHPGGSERSLANINQSIDTTLAVSRHEWKYVAEVVTDLDPQLPVISCVSDEINQALLNLVVNAAHSIDEANRKLARTTGQITIRTRHNDEHVIIEISDTGAGIPENVRHRIFEPFFTTKGVGKGTGQGLTIVHSIVVKHHSGIVDFTTEVMKGTTFRILLPIKPPIVEPNEP
jgi:PAS domain S-box-containing protein